MFGFWSSLLLHSRAIVRHRATVCVSLHVCVPSIFTKNVYKMYGADTRTHTRALRHTPHQHRTEGAAAPPTSQYYTRNM